MEVGQKMGPTKRVPQGGRPSRLIPLEADPLYPFCRAKDLPGLSLYWVPVTSFPMYSRERQWLMEFLKRFRDELKVTDHLRMETFLRFKSLTRDSMDQFQHKKNDYLPLTGLALRPGQGLPPVPSNEEVRKEIEDHAYNVNVAQWMPDYCYWLMGKQDEAQREDFFGNGDLLFLFLEPDPEAKAPPMFMPRILQTHPAMKDGKLLQQMDIAYAMKEKFLQVSKDLFGEGIRSHHVYPGIPFVVPLLSSQDFFSATPEERESWFSLFAAYCIESPEDNGLLLALKDEHFDGRMVAILDQLRKDGYSYAT